MANKNNKSMQIWTAFQWVFETIEQIDLLPSQQLALFHILGRVNRNFWKATPISLNKLSASMSMDKRTVKKAVDVLLDLGLVKLSKEGYVLGYSRKSVVDDAENSEGDNSRIQTTPDIRGEVSGVNPDNGSGGQSADGEFRYFNKV